MAIKCNRCDTNVDFTEVSEDYFAYCPTHDEDLYSFEVHDDALVIGDWVFTKRGERVVITLATLILLTVMVIVGSIE